ncbi:MAG: T9SS type A sorting domain-containing protein [Desulfobacterales bacterium]|nr:T9SS type A sorting domain-containing protein [Desulfobacterales bacterium]
MKKALLVLSAAIAVCASAQNYQLKFTTSGDSLNIDSVVVQNLATDSIFTMAGIDSLYLVDSLTVIKDTADTSTVALADYQLSNSELQVFPNPAYGQSTVQFFANSGTVTVNLYDIAGKLHKTHTQYVSQGTQRFTVECPGHGVYVVQVNANGTTRTTRISNLNTNGTAGIQFNSTRSNILQAVAMKAAKGTGDTSLNEMVYKHGQWLKITAYSGNYKTVLTDSLRADSTYSVEFFPCTDGDDNHYPIVNIKGQIWMAENLRTTKFNDGADIAEIQDATTWENLNMTKQPAFCWYNNDSANHAQPYGALYNAFVATDVINNVCPTGWHVPSLDEWQQLIDTLGGTAVAGKKLKSTDKIGWDASDKHFVPSTNETGFSIVGAGMRYKEVVTDPQFEFLYLNESGTIYTSTVVGIEYREVSVSSSNDEIDSYDVKDGNQGYSLRCLKD